MSKKFDMKCVLTCDVLVHTVVVAAPAIPSPSAQQAVGVSHHSDFAQASCLCLETSTRLIILNIHLQK